MQETRIYLAKSSKRRFRRADEKFLYSGGEYKYYNNIIVRNGKLQNK